MSDEDRYIPGVPCWVDSTQPDPAAAAEFYSGLWGWKFEDIGPTDPPGVYLVARLPGGDVAAVGGAGPGEEVSVASWNTYVWVDDADATAELVRGAGGTVVAPPFDAGDAGRMAVFADPDGASFRVWQPKDHRGAAVVNEPGSVNFNDLKTHDLEAARSFYGAVFGWDLLDADGMGMWALPAYGDFLERRTPGTRASQAEMGAPPRFEEVVASAAAIPADELARWEVTFAADDADAVASRAASLGGQVVVPPFDAPWVRMTVIRDPAGATFTASQFKPENKDLG